MLHFVFGFLTGAGCVAILAIWLLHSTNTFNPFK